MKNKKGFTLIELLAVIIILGILMLIAIPSVTTYVNNSKKNAYIASAKKTVEGTALLVNSQEIYLYETDTTYYIPGSCITMESSSEKSPYGDWSDRYIVVTYDGDNFDYYWTSTDSANMGVYLTHREKLDIDDIKTQVQSIPTTIGVGNRDKIIVFEAPCDFTPAPIQATDHIPEKGRYTPSGNAPSGGGTTGSNLVWHYRDFEIVFDKVTDGCDQNQGSEVVCYNAEIHIKNTSSTDTIKRWVATFDVPPGTTLINGGWDPGKAVISLDGTTLTIDGIPSGQSYNYLTPGKSETLGFQIKYRKDSTFKLSNGNITYVVLSEDIQTGTSGVQGTIDNMYITLNKFKIELERTNYWGTGTITGNYNVYVTNLTSQPITDWSFIMELPEEYTNITTWSPLIVTNQTGRVYTLGPFEWDAHRTIQAGERIKYDQKMQLSTTDPNVLPIIR